MTTGFSRAVRPGDGARAPTPPLAPLPMPSQDLRAAPEVRHDQACRRTRLTRIFLIGGTAALTAFGFDQMLAVFDAGRIVGLQIVLLGLFTITFAWIGFAALAALAGLLPLRPPRAAATPMGRTAILMPLYNEDPAPPAAALQAMAEGLIAAGAGRRFEVFVLSDTRDPDVWVRETAAIARLRAALGGRMAVWYRRRPRNAGRKAGNLRDFVERWGGRYDHMLVLDADSVMEPATVLALEARMAAEPRLGILQTVPVLAGGESLFGRLQGFAGRLYGPVIARGTAAWQGADGNYWGHNALIRTRAFAEAAGLPDLPGRPPFGGHILSHDFVEAALIRRAGWQVRMDPDLSGSYEGAPPSLVDLAARDRRWAQGNLQHARVIGARGLRWPSRLHLGIGIGAYLMSAIWLAMLLVGAVLGIRAAAFRHQYFAETAQLYPDWPVFDAGRMLALFLLAMALLLLPKAIGLARAMIWEPRAYGGRLRLAGSFVAEIALSALYAPVLMLMQVAQLVEILRGRDSGWSAQARGGGRTPWRVVATRHWHHAVIGLAAAAALAALAPAQALWLSPVLAGLALAPLASRLSGCTGLGATLARAGLLATPEERTPPPAFARSAALAPGYAAAVGRLSLAALARDPAARAAHAALAGNAPAPERTVWLAEVTARAKVEAVEDPEAALALLTTDERLALAALPELLDAWASRPAAPIAGLSLAGE
jgi:membrane glycosyltransferase